MEIKINTKYNIGDIVFAYEKGYGFAKYRIADVSVNKLFDVALEDINYKCVSEVSCYLQKYEFFNEKELFTKQDITAMLEKLQKE